MAESLQNSRRRPWHRPNINKAMMRQWCHTIFFLIIRVLIFVNQLLLMVPFLCSMRKPEMAQRGTSPNTATVAKWHFRTRRWVTVLAIVMCVTLSAAAPFLVKMTTDLYDTTRNSQDSLFEIIANFTMATDVLCSLLLMAAQIWNREIIVEILNLFADVIEKMQSFEPSFVGFKILLTLLLKLGLTIYDMVLSLPFIVSASGRLTTGAICAFVANLFLQHLSSVFALTLFTFILLLLALSQQLERQLKLFENISNNMKMLQLIAVQNALQRLMNRFVATFQFGIFLIILVTFVTILCNIYALLDYYVTTQHFYWTFITYICSIALALYSLILVTYLCDRSQRRVRDLFLIREEQYFLKMPVAYEDVDASVLWPQLEEFYILGMFPLNNDLALFLVTYSVNFIIIILEFEINKAATH